ncbi:MAG: metal ABC transporter permease, partial [Rubripirellula sp.]|nr:metal ABC transporter permease [Rubripirellula sp.]
MSGVLAEVGWSWQLDGWIVLVAILCAVASASLGCFLVLRRMSMLGDAISHAVLPGLAVAFFLSHSRSSLPMFIGAVIVGILTAFFTEWIHRVGRVDKGASMGVVFTSLFALGLVMIVQAADKVDLDAGCVLYGSIELTPLDTMSLFGFEIPRAVVTLGIVTVINLAFVLLFYKELKLSSFDPSLATTLGFNASLMHYLLMILVAVTAVASFESVGSVLVVAMFVVPPAAAYLLTDRLGMMLLISVSLAISSALLGHLGAIHVPSWFGFQSTTTSGMMAVAAGSIFLITMLCSPSQGVLVKLIRRQALSLQIIADDVVAVLFRRGEKEAGEPQSASVTEGELIEAIFCGRWSLRLV